MNRRHHHGTSSPQDTEIVQPEKVEMDTESTEEQSPKKEPQANPGDRHVKGWT